MALFGRTEVKQQIIHPGSTEPGNKPKGQQKSLDSRSFPESADTVCIICYQSFC